jgi:regulator of sigma E protease
MLHTLLNILIALLLLGVIVAFHEFGHFIIAKARGITVSEFSIGMGPRLISFVKGGTRYSLKLLPIGGSCAMGEDDTAPSEDEHAFNNKNVWERIAVIFAGPVFNFILAFIFALVVIGIVGYDPAYVMSVNMGEPAEEQGLMRLDRVTKINGKKIRLGREILTYFYFHTLDDSEVTVEYVRTDESGKETTGTVTYKPKYVKKYLLGFNYTPGEQGPAKVNGIIEGYPMEKAGLKPGDIITALNGDPIQDSQGLAEYLARHPLSEQEIDVTYLRDGTETTVKVTPMYSTEGYSLGFEYNTGYREKTGFFGVIKYSFFEVKYWIEATVGSLGQLFTGKLSTQDIGGPVRIVSEIGNVVDQSREDGPLYIFLNLLNWAILLSANLGIMNLLPIPALDGGRLLFLFIEVVRGKPIDKEKEGIVNLIGIVLLFLLMIFIFFNDIRNVFFR